MAFTHTHTHTCIRELCYPLCACSKVDDIPIAYIKILRAITSFCVERIGMGP